MIFAQPVYLYIAAAAVPVFILFLIWSEQQRRAAMARLGSPLLIAQLSAGVNQRGRLWQRVLWVATLFCLLLAMARPQWGDELRTVERQGLQIVVALDVSTSMLADDIKPNRLERARLEISELMQKLDGDELALVLFSGASFIQFPLTSDYGTARRFLESARPGVVSKPGTNLSEALTTANSAFDDNAGSQRVILLITDGEAHDQGALVTAQRLAEAGILLYTIGFGSPDGATVPELDYTGRVVGAKLDEAGNPVISRLDEETLRRIAEVGGGEYYRAGPNGDELDALMVQLAGLQEGALGSRLDVRRVERFQIFLALALAALAGSMLIPEHVAPVRRPNAAQARPALQGDTR